MTYIKVVWKILDIIRKGVSHFTPSHRDKGVSYALYILKKKKSFRCVSAKKKTSLPSEIEIMTNLYVF